MTLKVEGARHQNKKAEQEMKGLAIYTLIIMGIMSLYVFLSPDYEVLTKLFCLGMYTPIVILAIKVVKGDR